MTLEERDDVFCEEDDFAKYLNELQAAEGESVRVVVPERIALVKQVFREVKESIDESSANVECSLFEVLPSYGFVTIEGERISIEDPKAFAEAVALSDSFEILTKLNGNTRMSFSFTGLTREVGDYD